MQCKALHLLLGQFMLTVSVFSLQVSHLGILRPCHRCRLSLCIDRYAAYHTILWYGAINKAFESFRMHWPCASLESGI